MFSISFLNYQAKGKGLPSGVKIMAMVLARKNILSSSNNITMISFDFFLIIEILAH